MAQHLHSLRRFSETMFYCTGPTCYQKFRLAYIDGKLIECPVCHEQFILIARNVKADQSQLSCDKCQGIESEFITVEEAHRRLDTIARETFKSKLAETTKVATLLQKKEIQLRELESELKTREDRIVRRELKLRERYGKCIETIQKRKEGLKLAKEKVKPDVEMSIENMLKELIK